MAAFLTLLLVLSSRSAAIPPSDRFFRGRALLEAGVRDGRGREWEEAIAGRDVSQNALPRLWKAAGAVRGDRSLQHIPVSHNLSPSPSSPGLLPKGGYSIPYFPPPPLIYRLVASYILSPFYSLFPSSVRRSPLNHTSVSLVSLPFLSPRALS